MKSTINVFSKGLSTDLHPLTVGKEYLTDALNATFITNNGNEYLLQNDMGNAIIQDSTTGSIMGLKDGFIPLGMKEHGGVLYVASFNPTTKEGELGSIPSPIFNYTFDEYPNGLEFDNLQLYNVPESSNKQFSILDLCKNEFINISDKVFLTGDCFFLNLSFDSFSEKLLNTVHKKYDASGSLIAGYDKYDFYLFNPVGDALECGPGLFDIELFAKSAKTSKFIPIISTNPCKLNNEDNNLYWFRINESCGKINNVIYQNNLVYTQYPNIQPGSLYIKLKLRKIYSNFQFIVNTDTQLNSPYYYYEYIE